MVASKTYASIDWLDTNDVGKKRTKNVRNRKRNESKDQAIDLFTEDSFDSMTNPEWDGSFLENKQSQQEAVHIESPTKERDRSYELILMVALLCGLAVYLVWQQAQAQMVSLEDELTLLQDELTILKTADTLDASPDTASAQNNNELSQLTSFETTYLHFYASQRTVDTAKQVAPQIDELYQQYATYFGLGLNSMTDKLTFIIDGSGLQGSIDENRLVVSYPERTAVKAKALANTLSARVAIHLLEQAVDRREIKPQWRSIKGALSLYLLGEHGHNPDWKERRSARYNRTFAQTLSLEKGMQIVRTVNAPIDSSQYGDGTQRASSEIFTDPLVEYMLETYGYAHVPSLLDAFEEHETWETLAPAVYEISAIEFEVRWHQYLATHYPSKANPEK